MNHKIHQTVLFLTALLLPQVLTAREQQATSTVVAVITNHEGAHLGAYFAALALSKETSGVVLADPSGETVAAAKAALGGKFIGTYGSAEALFAEHRPAVALVSLEPRLAPAAISRALDAGCHVIAEKPAVLSLEEFAPLARKAKEKGLHIMLALANRLHPEMQFAHGLIARGKIGTIYGVELHMIADQTRLSRPGYQKSWYAQKARSGGGYLIWLGIHWLDLAMYLTGLSIEQVAGFVTNVGEPGLDVEDSASLSMVFSNGSLGTMNAGYYLDKGYHSRIKIWGSKGWVEINRHGGETPLRYYSSMEENAGIRTFIPSGPDGGYVPFITACIRASLGLEPPPLTTDDSARVINTLFMAYKAAETGHVQRVP